MGLKIGRLASVRLGATQVLGIGTWEMSGITTDQLESTEFGDAWKTYEYGLKDGGQITFSGLYDPADTTGQNALRTYNEESTQVTSLRLYVDNTSYWIPATTGPASYVVITAYDVKADKSGMMTCSFTAKVSGKMELL